MKTYMNWNFKQEIFAHHHLSKTMQCFNPLGNVGSGQVANNLEQMIFIEAFANFDE